MTTILSFPPELWVLLMTHCDSPIDLNSLMNASPDASRRFFADIRSILKSRVKGIRATFGSIPAVARRAARIRHAKQKEGINTLHRKEAEKKVKPIATSYLARSETDTEQFFLARLGHLYALSTIITEAEWIASQYAPQAWNYYKHMNREDLPPLCVNLASLSNGMELSLGEKEKVSCAVFWLESYCQVFFRGEEVMFKGDTNSRRVYVEEEAGVSEDANIVNRFYWIVYYVFDQHWSLLGNVAWNLPRSRRMVQCRAPQMKKHVAFQSLMSRN